MVLKTITSACCTHRGRHRVQNQNQTREPNVKHTAIREWCVNYVYYSKIKKKTSPDKREKDVERK